MQYTYFVPRNTTKLTTRGNTSPDGVEMTLTQERKSGTAILLVDATCVQHIYIQCALNRTGFYSKG